MSQVLDCGLEVGVFELPLHCYVHFRINIPGRDIELHYNPINESNSTTAVLL